MFVRYITPYAKNIRTMTLNYEIELWDGFDNYLLR